MTFRLISENRHITGMVWFTIVDTPPKTPSYPHDDCWCLLISAALGGWISYSVTQEHGKQDTPELTEEFLALLSDEQKARAIAIAMRNRSNT